MEDYMRQPSYEERIQKLQRKMEDLGADTAWIIQPENRRYLSGFTADDMQLTESSGSLLISGAHRLLITDSRYTEQAKREAPSFEIVTVKGDIIKEFPDIVGRIGSKVVGFEDGYLVWGTHQKLVKRLEENGGKTRLLPLGSSVESLRKIKDSQELAALRASAAMITTILREVVQWLRPGMTEKEVAWHIEDLARRAGAEAMAFPPIVASGPNGALPHAVPSSKPIKEGEPIILDVGVKLNGYCSDVTRTVFLGEPDPFFREIYAIVRKAQISALKTIRPGITSDMPDKVAREVITEAGYGEYFGHALGHGVGLATHEGPRLSPSEPEPLVQGMVVTVEPGIYIPDKGGVRLEETIVITRDGAEVLTKGIGFYEVAP
ncbi:MAG: aminopeptidase P family protein [Deltaproteobacteria bacterium]|nr:MAG: aminopeptidase P family protein [Deltaproteobacteria bacterium]